MLVRGGQVGRLVAGGTGEVPKGGRRGQVREWSRASRRRALRTVLACEWPADLVHVTLTYPAAERPMDGRVSAGHLLAFRHRWRRRFGADPVGLWKREFQANGSVHYHLWLVRPGLPFDDPGSLSLGVATWQTPEGSSLAVSTSDLRAWVAEAWAGVVKAKSLAHRKAGTKVAPWEGSPGAYIAAYTVSKSAKEYQHKLPAGFVHPGRWWGLWGIAPRWEEIEITREEFFAIRRRMVRLLKSRGIKYKRRGVNGMWVSSASTAELFRDYLVEWRKEGRTE